MKSYPVARRGVKKTAKTGKKGVLQTTSTSSRRMLLFGYHGNLASSVVDICMECDSSGQTSFSLPSQKGEVRVREPQNSHCVVYSANKWGGGAKLSNFRSLILHVCTKQHTTQAVAMVTVLTTTGGRNWAKHLYEKE